MNMNTHTKIIFMILIAMASLLNLIPMYFLLVNSFFIGLLYSAFSIYVIWWGFKLMNKLK
jgi:hypothetical protein